MPKGILIIGLGQIGMEYDLNIPIDQAVFSHARAFFIHPAFEILGAVDPSSEKRSSFTQKYDKPAFADIAEALHRTNPQVVVIASPTDFHKANLVEVLSLSSPLAILCEKPLANNISDARLMIDLCEQSGVDLFVNYMRRSEPGSIKVKDLIYNGLIEVPIKGIAWYSKGFLHNGSHLFNLLEFWLGAYQRSTLVSAGRHWQDFDPEPDVFVEFEKGSIIFLAAWEESFSHYTIELLSHSGRLRYEKGGEHITWQATYADPSFKGYTILNDSPELIPNSMNRYQWHVTDQLSKALDGQTASICSGIEALTTLEYMHQIINTNKK
jgi:predicted dehydrogenase